MLPADDPLLGEVEVILQSTGIMSGEFGFVEAAKRVWFALPDTNG